MDRLKKISATAFTREKKSNSKMIFDLENYRCRHYYSILIKFIYERPKKWGMLADKFNLTEEQLSKIYLIPLHVASEPYVRSFQYRVFNCNLFTNDLLVRIGYIASPSCTFCNEALETFQHLLFYCTVSQAFWNDVIHNILSKLSSCVSRHALRDLIHISRDTWLAGFRTMCVRHVDGSSD